MEWGVVTLGSVAHAHKLEQILQEKSNYEKLRSYPRLIIHKHAGKRVKDFAASSQALDFPTPSDECF